MAQGIDGLHIHHIHMKSRVSNKDGALLANQANSFLSLSHLEENVESAQLLINNKEVSNEEDSQVPNKHYQKKEEICCLCLYLLA